MLQDRPLSSVNEHYATPPHSPLPSQSLPLEHDRLSPFNSAPYPDQANNHSAPLVPSPIGQDYDKEGATPAESTAFLQGGKDSDAIPSQRGSLIATTPFRRRPLLWALGLTALVAVALAVIFPVYFTVIRRNGHGSKSSIATDSPHSGSGSGSGTGSGNGNPASSNSATSGGDGSTIISGNTSFTYSNPFGGYCEFVVAYLNPLKICENLRALFWRLYFCASRELSPSSFSVRALAMPQGHQVVTSSGFTDSVPRQLCNETGTIYIDCPRYRLPNYLNIFPRSC
jgi:hypothetical protein